MATTSAPVISLSTKGVLISPTEKVDALLAYFKASDANQTYLFKGRIANLSILCQKAGNDIPTLKRNIIDVLQDHMGPHFEHVEISIRDDTDTNESFRVNLYLSILVTQDGKSSDVAALLTTVNGKFEKITTFNNTGQLT
jgi:hypothetical protein